MSGPGSDRAREIFERVRGMRPDERAAALEELCAADAALRAEVESLILQEGVRTAELGSRPGAGSSTSQTLAPGDELDGYRVLSVLGEGGFGHVYLAQQTEPVRRRVALKVLKAGMDTASILARFQAEQQALAMMDHPGVARVYDAGVTPHGLPYFVMEYVEGLPITEHCDRQQLDIAQRIDLFTRVCDAVQHAHAKGVIHRDLKPANILVRYDGDDAAPKVIDFGVAKALNQPLTEGTIFTQHGQLIGTPEYMSPEQAEMSPQGIDTRSDVYSLGVVLYELLTGGRPFESETLRRAGLAEIQRIIREVEPPKPSTRVETLVGDAASQEAASRVAKARRTDSRALSRRVRGDLDWIVMKCMEKDRGRRYISPDALASDLRAFLRDEPVGAGPPSASYRARKFVRRHRAGVVLASTFTLALLLGLSLALWQWRTAEAERARADAQRELADQRFEQLRTLAGTFLFDFHDAIEQLPGSTDARRMVVDTAVEYLDLLAGERAGDDQLALELAKGWERVGDIRAGRRSGNLGEPSAAAQAYERSLEILEGVDADTDRPRAVTLLKRGDLLRTIGDLDAAARQYGDARLIIERLAAGGPPDTPLRRALAASVLAAGKVRAQQGDLDGALRDYRASLELREQLARDVPDDDRVTRSLAVGHSNIAELHLARGDLQQAARHAQRSSEIRETMRRAQPENARRVRDSAAARRLVGRIAVRRGDRRTAYAALAEAQEDFAWLVEQDPDDARVRLDLAQTMEVYGDALADAGETARAVALFETALGHCERLLADGSRNAIAMNTRAVLRRRAGSALLGLGRTAEARAALRQAAREHDSLAEGDPTNASWLLQAASSNAALADAIEDSAPSEALERYRRAERLCERLLADGGEVDPAFLSDLASRVERLRDRPASP